MEDSDASSAQDPHLVAPLHPGVARAGGQGRHQHKGAADTGLRPQGLLGRSSGCHHCCLAQACMSA
eukprot:1157854-Pelagomonas_calceolata.AAC.7